MAFTLFPTFPSNLEADFKNQYNHNSARVAWFGAWIAQILYVAFYFWDRVIDVSVSTETLIIRIAVFSWFFLIVMLPRATFSRHLQAIFTASISISGIGVVIIISILKDGLNLGLSGVILVLMFNFGFFRLLFVPSLLSGGVVCISYDLAAIYNALPSSLIVANNFFLVSAFVSGASVTYLLERLFRIQFLGDKELALERNRTNMLMDNLLPNRIAERLKAGEKIIAESHGEATVFFSDLVGFTALTKRLSPGHLIEVLNDVFSTIDGLTEKYKVEKIKTTGDGYMVVSGVEKIMQNSAEAVADFSLEVVKAIRSYAEKHDFPLAMRIGIQYRTSYQWRNRSQETFVRLVGRNSQSSKPNGNLFTIWTNSCN